MSADHERRAPDVSVEFHKESTAPRRARKALQPLLDDPDDPISEAVETVTSELVSNVIQHTADGGTVKAWDPKPDQPFHLEVADDEACDPVSPDVPPQEGGRGLRIVEALADEWGVEHRGGKGKTVWADFNRPT